MSCLLISNRISQVPDSGKNFGDVVIKGIGRGAKKRLAQAVIRLYTGSFTPMMPEAFVLCPAIHLTGSKTHWIINTIHRMGTSFLSRRKAFPTPGTGLYSGTWLKLFVDRPVETITSPQKRHCRGVSPGNVRTLLQRIIFQVGISSILFYNHTIKSSWRQAGCSIATNRKEFNERG